MVDVLALAFVVGGIVLLFAGATLSTYAVAGVGVLIGASAGYLFGPALVAVAGVTGPLAPAVAVLIGAVIGVVLTYLLLSFVVALISFVVGSYVGIVAVAPTVVDGAWYAEWAAALAIGIAAAAVAVFLTRSALVGLTAFLGATFASRSVTPADFEAARASISIEPLTFDVTAPVFLALLALGLLTQVGLFRIRWVRKAVEALPGVKPIRNRRRRADPSET